MKIHDSIKLNNTYHGYLIGLMIEEEKLLNLRIGEIETDID